MSVLSVSDQIYICQAAEESNKSTLLSRHGCVAVVNGKILGRGHNSARTQSYDGFIYNTCSCHAEMAALRNVFHSCYMKRYGKYSNLIKGEG